jgi:hypothetical protein
MKQLFNQLSDKLLTSLTEAEHLKMSINGENSQFIRFSQSKIRPSLIREMLKEASSTNPDWRILD